MATDLLLAAGIGYLLGAIPSGVLIGRLRGVDPRTAGSGRTGTTNAIRTLGLGWAAAVAALDLGKGVAAALIGEAVAPGWGGAVAGVAAVIGHVRSVFIGFGGGRGVATGGGALAVLAPMAVGVALAELLVVIAATRYVSLGSILAAITVALVSAVLAALRLAPLEAAVAAAAIAVIVTIAHADNIERLRAGTERRIGRG
jgi:glycerol-3-phosphate acyltransferase PlsY